jgi:glycine cleavage system H protein
VDDPQTVNASPHEEGWLIVLEVGDPAAAAELLDASAYEEQIAQK